MVTPHSCKRDHTLARPAYKRRSGGASARLHEASTPNRKPQPIRCANCDQSCAAFSPKTCVSVWSNKLQPNRKMVTLQGTDTTMDQHRVPRIAAFMKDGITPKFCDLLLMCKPYTRITRQDRKEDGSQNRVLPYQPIKCRNDLGDFMRCYVYPRFKHFYISAHRPHKITTR